jgi:hypothetical protein
MLVLRILTAILWSAIKIIEHRSAGLEIIIIEEEECPVMRDRFIGAFYGTLFGPFVSSDNHDVLVI